MFNFLQNLLSGNLNLLATKIIPILMATVGFSFVIVIHELGHFIFCKLFNVTVPSFSIGFGPVLLHKTIAGTKFQIALMPFGGYNEIKDETELDRNGNTVPTQDSFASKPYWQKLIILSGGIALNILLAIVFFSGLNFFGQGQMAVKEFKITQVLEDSPAKKAGLKDGYSIIGMDNLTFETDETFNYATFSQNLHKNLGKTINLQVKNLNNETDFIDITLNTLEDAKKNSAMGVKLEAVPNTKIKPKKLCLRLAIKNGIKMTFQCISSTFYGLKQIITTRSLESMGGPVMIISQSVKQAKEGFAQLMFFLAYISVSIAIINLFPLGALDGGRILLESAESLVGRHLPALRIVTQSGTILLLILIGALFYKDLYRLILG